MSKSDFYKSNPSEPIPITTSTKFILPDNDQDSESNELGERIREIRLSRSLSIRELAAQAGISVNALSLIENGKTSPSVNTLQKIARALHVAIPKFFQPVREEKNIVFTKASGRPNAETNLGIIQYLSKDLIGNVLDAMIVTIHPETHSGDEPILHNGYEFVYCLGGKILYSVGNDHFLLEPGDSLAFEPILNHHWQNLDSGDSQYLLVIFNSSFTDQHDVTDIHNFLTAE